MDEMHDLTEAALVAAPPIEVWRDLMDPARLAEWIWPPRFETTAAVDGRAQGEWIVRSDAAGIAIRARIVVADAPHELRLQWRWEGEEHATDVRITLEEAAGGATRVIVRHDGFRSAAERDEHIQGWTDCLDRLVHRHPAPPPLTGR